MGGDHGARHRCKEHLFSLEQELRSDYGLSVFESRALVQRVARQKGSSRPDPLVPRY